MFPHSATVLNFGAMGAEGFPTLSILYRALDPF